LKKLFNRSYLIRIHASGRRAQAFTITIQRLYA
jgi:hypothetical protein